MARDHLMGYTGHLKALFGDEHPARVPQTEAQRQMDAAFDSLQTAKLPVVVRVKQSQIDNSSVNRATDARLRPYQQSTDRLDREHKPVTVNIEFSTVGVKTSRQAVAEYIAAPILKNLKNHGPEKVLPKNSLATLDSRPADFETRAGGTPEWYKRTHERANEAARAAYSAMKMSGVPDAKEHLEKFLGDTRPSRASITDLLRFYCFAARTVLDLKTPKSRPGLLRVLKVHEFMSLVPYSAESGVFFKSCVKSFMQEIELKFDELKDSAPVAKKAAGSPAPILKNSSIQYAEKRIRDLVREIFTDYGVAKSQIGAFFKRETGHDTMREFLDTCPSASRINMLRERLASEFGADTDDEDDEDDEDDSDDDGCAQGGAK